MARYDFWEHDGRLAALKEHPLFRHRLLPDILAGAVFPAIRVRKIDFYSRGRKLCSFNGTSFQANVAYLAAFQDRPSGEVTEEAFGRLKLCATFIDGYEQIKKNIELHEQPESGGVSDLCEAHSCYVGGVPRQIGVFDIELSLEAGDDDRSQDRLDLVLFHRDERRLRFFEVKTFDNPEIWPKDGKSAAVCGQVARYKEQLARREQELLDGYQRYARLMADLCGVPLPEPATIDVEPDLLLIGFDSLQQATIASTLRPEFKDKFRWHAIGNPTSASPATLAKWWKR